MMINELDRVEILTLQDNYIDMTAMDNSAMIHRAGSRVKGQVRKSVLAEHGFSAVIRTTAGERTRTMLFDFGFSEIGAAYNAKALDVPMGEIEAIALSHGHSDHMGGFRELVKLIGKPGIELVVHPGAFKAPRYLKIDEEFKAYYPRFTREMTKAAGTRVVEAKEPWPLLGGDVLFLGEIPRRTEFEKGMPNAYFEEGVVEKKDDIEDDTSLCMNLKGKGLIVLSGCAHSGIVNTVRYAREATGVEAVHVIMGGFHLNGPVFEPIVGRTIEELRKINPRYIVPTHCTGRKSIQQIEASLPESFILNMAGTRLTFAA
ncbi:MAG: MBL fold metallo-hydrolase [Proteobacteria bacterium]|nr:MBL fold metallo-hydrolase [Pseudomonadota bacterium]